MQEIIVSCKNGTLYINGHLYTFETKKIRSMIESMSEVNDKFRTAEKIFFCYNWNELC